VRAASAARNDMASLRWSAVVMMLPPVIVFAALNRYFSVGGNGGSLAGT
jgi:multiple sugar transport system permease protein